MFDSNTQPKFLEKEDWIVRDIHCVPSLIKLFFRELPASPLQALNVANNNDKENKYTTYNLLRNALSTANLNSDKREALRDFKSALDLLSRAQFRYINVYRVLHLRVCTVLTIYLGHPCYIVVYYLKTDGTLWSTSTPSEKKVRSVFVGNLKSQHWQIQDIMLNKKCSPILTTVTILTTFLSKTLLFWVIGCNSYFTNRYIQAESWLVLVSTLCSKKCDF